jgi:hypothetical protein
MVRPYRDQDQIDGTAGRRFTRGFVIAFGVAALIGLSIGIVWVIAGLLHFHVLR